MRIKFNNKYIKWGVTAFFVLAAAILFYYFINNSGEIKSGIDKIINILMPVVVGMAIAYLLTPVLNFMERSILIPIFDKLKIKNTAKRKSYIRIIGILGTAFLFAWLIYMLFYMLISQIVPSVHNLITNFDTYSVNITKWINKVLEDNPDVGNYINKTVYKYTNELENWIEDFLPNTLDLIKTVSMSVLGVFGVIWNFVIGFIISIYVLANKENFASQAKKGAYALFEQDTANTLIRNMRFTHNTFIGFLGGKILDSLIIGMLCFIGTTLMTTPYAALVSVIIGVTNIIPFFGPFLGAVPSVFLIFIVDPMHPLNCLYFVIFVLILQQVDGNIIGPKILGDSTGLTGFWVIFAITLFGGLFGVLGMVIGVPFFAVIYAGIRSLFNTKLMKKELPTESYKYETIDYIDENGLHEIVIEDQKKHSKRKFLKKSSSNDSESIEGEKKDYEISDSEGK